MRKAPGGRKGSMTRSPYAKTSTLLTLVALLGAGYLFWGLPAWAVAWLYFVGLYLATPDSPWLHT